MSKKHKRHQKQVFQQQQRAEAAINATYASAGRKAFAMLIPVDGCIYRDQKAKSLWLAGYKNAEREAAWQSEPYMKRKQSLSQKSPSTKQE